MRAVGLGAGDSDEQKSRLDLAAVGGDADDLERAMARVDRGVGQKIAQAHRDSFALTSSS